MLRTLLAGFALTAPVPALAAIQDAPPSPATPARDPASFMKARQAFQQAASEAYAKAMEGREGRLSEEEFAAFQASLAPIRAAICAEYALEPSTMTAAQIEMVADVLTPTLSNVADARLDELRATPDADGFEAALAEMRRDRENPNALAELLAHPGLDDYLAQRGMSTVVRTLASQSPEQLRAATPALLALGDRFAATPDGMSGVAGYMKAIVDLGDAVTPERREELRQSLLARTEQAMAAAESIEDETKRKEAVDRLKRSVVRLDSAPMKGPIVDKPATNLTLEWVHDGTNALEWTSLESLRGKVVVLDFWATWCGPCVASFPNVRELRAHYAADDVVILGVTSLQGRHYPRGSAPIDCTGDADKERSLMPGYMEAMEITWPVAFTSQEVFNPDYDVNGIPHVAIIDANGVLRHNGLHPASPLEKKTELIDPLLVEAGKTPPTKSEPKPELKPEPTP